ncbi:MAG TPA: MIP/aquaporin family protein [Solirubrobacteraceae bacterium]|jgi:glycerol uptake facilitator protein|nr:MIP/aquaporin family protein [Solirubrobacteraceae bacterium]
MKRKTLAGELSAEFLGTFVILIFGIGVVAQVVLYGGSFGDYTVIPFAWGFGVALAIYVAGGISGAHLNPAVTLALALRRGFAWKKVLPFWGAQIAGAFVAAALMYFNYQEAFHRFDPHKTFKSQGVFSTLTNGVSVLGGLRDQIILTAILVGLIFALIDDRNTAPKANMAPFLIGVLIIAIGEAFGSNSGWAINPARDFGPRLFEWIAGWSTAWETKTGAVYFWVPIIGPLIGGAIGAFTYDFFIGRFLPIAEDDEEVGRAHPQNPDVERARA